MNDYSDSRYRNSFDRFVRYLTTRRSECWGFFIAGLLIGGIFF